MTDVATAAPAAPATDAGSPPPATETQAEGTGSILTATPAEGVVTPLDQDAAASDAKPTESDPATPEDGEAKPIEYTELKVPEGHTMDEAALSEFKDLSRELDLPADKAQKLMDRYAAEIQKVQTAGQQLFKETNEKWISDVKNDAELGGKNFDVVKSTFSKALGQFGNPAELKAFDIAFGMTGAGNHPDAIRLLYRMAKGYVESGSISGRAPKAAKSVAETLYPNHST